jgi:TolB-like protein
MNKLITQLKERRIWRVVVAYPSVTFVLLQAIEFFINNYDLDPRFLTALIIAAAVMLPAAFVWNWRHGEVGIQAFTRGETGIYAISAVASIAAVVWYWNVTPAEIRLADRNEAAARSVAVMPFENAGGDAEVQYLCDGIAEGLINWLATVPDIKVASKTASFRLRDDSNDTAKLAQALGVDSIIRGRLEKIGARIVISAALVDTRDESQLWGERLVRPADEVIFLERSIVSAIKDGLALEVADGTAAVSASEDTDSPEAYEHYLRGHFLIQSTNLETIGQGLDELRAAIKIDPGFARAYADIADALSQMLSYGIWEGDKLLGEARNAAYTAVGLAPNLAEAQTALATILQYFEFDFDATDAAYEAAIALEPQSPVPYHRYTDYLVLTLRLERAREMAVRALAIDSLDSSSMHALGLADLVAGDFTTSARSFGEWNKFHPGSRWSYVKHSLALSLDGQCDKAFSQAQSAERLTDGQMSPLMNSWLAWGYKVCGNDEWYATSKQRIEAALEANPRRFDPGYAYLLALEGDTDALVELLREIIETRAPFALFAQLFTIDYLGFGISDTLPKDPRYLALLEQLNFPPHD